MKKGRPSGRRGTTSGLFDLPEEPSSSSLSPNASPRHEASSSVLTVEDANASANNANIAERIWGHLYSMKQQIKKYSAGKIALDELQTRNQVTLKRILKFVQPRRPTASSGSGSTLPGYNSSPSSSPPTSSILGSVTAASISSTPPSSITNSTASVTSSSNNIDSYTATAVPRLLYVLQLDHYVVYLALVYVFCKVGQVI